MEALPAEAFADTCLADAPYITTYITRYSGNLWYDMYGRKMIIYVTPCRYTRGTKGGFMSESAG